MAHWLEMLWLIGWRLRGSLVKDYVAHWLEITWLIGWRLCGSLVGDYMTLWSDMTWVIAIGIIWHGTLNTNGVAN